MWSIINDDVPAWTHDRADTLRRVADERRLARLLRCTSRQRDG